MLRSHFPDVRLQKEAHSLINGGHTVKLVVWDRGRFNALDNSVLNLQSGIEIIRFKLSVPQDSLRLILCLPFWSIFICYHLIRQKYDIVHAADFDTYFPALLVTKLKRKIIFYDIYDFYADMMAFPVFPTIFRKIIANIDRSLMAVADEIILPDESRIKQINISLRKKPIIIVNSPSKSIVLSDIERSFDQKTKFKVFFGGGVSENRGIDDMCKAVRDLDNVELLVTGPCSEKYAVKLESLVNTSPNIKLDLKWKPYDVIINQTASADAVFALYNSNTPNQKYSSPNKLFEAMMCGKPILVSDGNSMADIVNREKCGVVVQYGNVGEIKGAINYLRSNRIACKEMGENGRLAFKERYSWNIMEERLLELYGRY
jgi:glycosyltransferase involved in cell wall biosynthesis